MNILDYIGKRPIVKLNTSDSIHQFMDKLSEIKSDERIFNQYRESEIAKTNLTNYFNLMELNQPKILLIGEAPGYKGCRISGIPFTSGQIIANSPIFMKYRQSFHFTSIEDEKENSANAFYELFEQHPELFNSLIMWNSYPFHPHKENLHETNRAPTTKELKIGAEFIKLIIDIFNINEIVPVGKKAEKVCKYLKDVVIHPAIRHPSFGGKPEFLRGMQELMRMLNIA